MFGAWGQGGAEATALGVGLAERCFLAAPSAASLRQARLFDFLAFWLSIPTDLDRNFPGFWLTLRLR